ncbi:hypothetical protein OGAPHI_006196 [Ogataea philodendri]|uniref:Uncharacterized protein n=1 Tax=Ogataea philodendri TaxID=1378263 RepID=A0A9P8T1J2_9ASCO|nr:uncharacterized protein OGAPHI_006196 [Ogataea philodendri]KAH3662015.1 hypothetical protein OGAPHI_006196 [Ogataea philodendri]
MIGEYTFVQMKSLSMVYEDWLRSHGFASKMARSSPEFSPDWPMILMVSRTSYVQNPLNRVGVLRTVFPQPRLFRTMHSNSGILEKMHRMYDSADDPERPCNPSRIGLDDSSSSFLSAVVRSRVDFGSTEVWGSFKLPSRNLSLEIIRSRDTCAPSSNVRISLPK